MNQPLKVLIVDDSPEDRESYIRGLTQLAKENAYTFVEADNGDDAMDVFDKAEVDIVLLDYSLPGKSGMSVLMELMGRDEFLPVIMLTGEGDEKIATQAIKQGARDYIVKADNQPGTLSRALRHAFEKSERSREMARQKDALISFARTLAHDLRSPTRSIRSMIELMALEFDETLNEDHKTYMDHIVAATHRMDNLIESLNEYSALDGLAPKMGAHEVTTIIDQALANVGNQIGDCNAEIMRHEMTDTLYGNATLIVQLLQNLISNGIKYCDEAKPQIVITISKRNDAQFIAVADNGIGIEEQYRQQIFEPFRRLHGQGEYTGSGLGLATCHRIVGHHGGRIWCEPSEFGGSTFCVELPLQEIVLH